MSKIDKIRKAKAAKNDEFYTRLEDIVAEIAEHEDYVKQFEGKIVYCNCDDPEWSAFWEFFRKFFHKLKLKKMISTHYNADGSPSYMLEWSGEMINSDTVNMIKKPLNSNGDFRSEECVELLKEADIVVTNPPFSLWTDYIALMEEYHKKYIIIGSKGAITYKLAFSLLRDGKLFIGYNAGNGTMYFATVPGGPANRSVPSYWYTNIAIDKQYEPLILTENYKGNEEKYPKYYNYDAIDVCRVSMIPKDYYGKMGVPITFMDKWCIEQFEIVGVGRDGMGISVDRSYDKKIKKEKPNARLGSVLYFDKNGRLKEPYTRIIIRRRKEK